MKRAWLGVGCVLALASACRDPIPSHAPQPVRVAAAADLALAFEEVGRGFTQATGHQVTFSFGSTGLLAAQIREGAPFDVFAAANVSFVNDVVKAGACDGSTQAPYARGRIAVWTKKGAPAPATLAELAEPRFRKVAIANPEHAPYGVAAKQALTSLGHLEAVRPRLVMGENVRQTHQFAATGNADAAIVALSLVALDHDNPWFLIDEALHAPIDQALVQCARGANREGGAAFIAYLSSAAGRAVMRRYGFLLPGEAVP